MKTNPYKGVSFSQLTQGIEDDRCAYSMNLVAHNDGFLQRRNSIVWMSRTDVEESSRILTVSTINIMGTEAVAYLIFTKSSSASKLYMLVKLFNGTTPGNREIRIDLDEAMLYSENIFFNSFSHIKASIVSVTLPQNETGLIISSNKAIETKNMYIISYDDKTQMFSNRKYALPSNFNSNFIDLIISNNNSSLGWTISSPYELSQLTITYDQNTKKFSALTVANPFSYNKEYGKMNCLIEIGTTTLVGTDHNILRITSLVTPGTPPTTAYSLSVAVFGSGIEKNGWIITNQNTLFCYGNKRFHNFPIESLEVNDQSIYVKNQPEYQYSVQELENLGLIIFPGAIRIFQSNRYGLIEICFGSRINNNYTEMFNVLPKLDGNCSEYFNAKTSMSATMFNVIYNPHNNGIYPVDRAEVILTSAKNSANIDSYNKSIFPQNFISWYSDGGTGIHNDLTSLNTKYFDLLESPLSNIEYGFLGNTFDSESNDIFLASIESATVFYQSKETKEDVVYVNNTVQQKQVQYPIILLSKSVDDTENSQDIRPSFTLGFRNCDGMTVAITDRATYMVGSHNMEEPVTYSLSSFSASLEKMNIMRKDVRCTTDASGRYGNCAGIIFITRSICVDIIAGLSLSSKTKASSKPSHY
ncbi:MAG: hypothetical protein ACRCX2_18530 [Paraclostridium sp.]